MKKILQIFILLFLTQIISAAPVTDFLQTLQNTSPKNSKTLLIFYKPDCQYCINMDNKISGDIDFQHQLTQKYNVQVLDITSPQGRLLADKFNIHAVPTIVNFDNATGESNIIKGFISIEKLSKKLGLSSKNNVEEKKQSENILSVCGDGILDAGEQCDDGNITNGDGCSSACTIQPGFTCVGSPSICTSTCGDGIIGGSEQCDDGNIVNGDGCSSTCTVQSGFYCAGSPSVCGTACGDGIVVGTEQCDDGNLNNGDGCSNTCQFEIPPNDECVGAIILGGTSGNIAGQNITATISTGVPTVVCAGPQKNDVWFKFTLASTKNCSFALNGPSIVDPTLSLFSGSCGSLIYVDCDDDNGPGLYSLLQKTLNAGTYFLRAASYNNTSTGTFSLIYNLNLSNLCGNNIIENTEECDDGNTINGDGCSSTCKTENAASITGVAINTDSVRANPSAMLDVKSFDKGILIPRMSTSQRTGIVSPAKGLLVFDIITNSFWFYSGNAWIEVGGTSGNAGGGLPAGTTSQTLRNNGTNWAANSTLQNDGTNVTLTGQVKINGGIPGNGKVLTSDAAGLGTWNTPTYDSSKNTFFRAINSVSQSFTGNLTPTFPSESADDGNNFSGNVFTVPANGVYQFHAETILNLTSVTSTSTIKIMIESVTNTGYGEQSVILPTGHSGFYSLSASGMAKLTAGTQMRIRFVLLSGTLGLQFINNINFSGYRIY